MMELNNKMLEKVAVLLFLMGFSATVEAGHQLDPSFITTQLFNNDDASYYSSRSSTIECCENCPCGSGGLFPGTLCGCLDIAESCHASCKHCDCTFPDPPGCRCLDAATNTCPIPECT